MKVFPLPGVLPLDDFLALCSTHRLRHDAPVLFENEEHTALHVAKLLSVREPNPDVTLAALLINGHFMIAGKNGEMETLISEIRSLRGKT